MAEPTPSQPDVLKLLADDAAELHAYFDRILARMADAPARLVESIRYSLLAGGKRLRPALVMETFRACGGTPDRQPTALAAAAAMELIHTFSLVHDDLPAMDDDDLRRGRPTNHKVFGEAMAILAGDAMTTLAFETIAADADPAVAPQLIRALALAAGPCGMIGGQVLDIDGEQKKLALPELQQIHRMKTGALLVASAELGALSAGAPETLRSAVAGYARHLGLAFQIVDDILDETATPEQLGKATHKDAGKGKNTYPSLLGLDASRREAAKQLQLALASLDPLGPRAAALRALAHFVIDRKS
jgi:geranylgeranyl pyrophosphate synthase